MIPRRNVTAFPQVLRALATDWPFEGCRERLEATLARDWGFACARAMTSGRAALEWLLQVVRPRTGPLAYVPAYTIEAIPRIARACGYEVAFLDLDADTVSVTAETLRRSYRGPGVAIVTHYFGLPADMPAVREEADALGIALIEDCAHAPGGCVGGKVVGSFGLGGALSFETRKPLNGLGGGMVVSCDRQVAVEALAMERPRPSVRQDVKRLAIAALEWTALRPTCFRVLAPFLYLEKGKELLVTIYRRLHEAGRDCRYGFSDFQAALVLRQLAGLEAGTAHRRAIAQVYDRHLPPEAIRPISPASRPHQYYMYVIRHPMAREFGQHLRNHGVDCGIGQEVLPLCAPAEVVPASAAVASTAVELPMHDAMTEDDARWVCEVAWRFRERGPRAKCGPENRRL